MSAHSKVLVVWADAHSAPHEWLDPDDMESEGELLVQTLGHLLPVGDGGKNHHVTVAQSMTSEGMVDHVIHIPVDMVRSMSVLGAVTDNA